MRDLAGQRVLVLGLGISGRSAAAFCAARGARVLAADERTLPASEALDALRAAGVALQQGAPFPDPAAFDLVVPSPGVPPARYRSRARRVWGDIELAFHSLTVPIVAVTGTNGKSTTVTLAEAMLRAAGLRARAAGNLGTPALELVGAPLDVAVLEVSSFQLETIEAFRADVGVILNIEPDHLDRHADFDDYVAAKARLLENQRPEDAAVLCVDHPAVAALADRCRGRVLPFSTRRPLERGAFLDAGAVVLAHGGLRARLPLDAVRLLGAHNRENVLAALCAAVAVGADPRKAWTALETFEGLPHRTQPVARRGGVLFVNDSKATNPAAALRSLASFDGPRVWIAGGRAKGLDMTALARSALPFVRAAVVLGEAAPALETALAGQVPVRRAGSIEEATQLAAELAAPGEIVLLSPGCSSHDQFRSYEERGDRFRDAVLALPDRSAQRPRATAATGDPR